MEVTNKSFSPALVEHLRAALKRALFVSFDLEMTGLASAQERASILDSPSERYGKMRKAVQRYSPLQFGLSVFEQGDGDSLIVRTFNCYTMPSPTKSFKPQMTLDTSSAVFLVDNHFSFDRFFADGLSYLRRSEEAEYRNKKKEEEERERAPVAITRTADKKFLDELIPGVEAWYKSGSADPYVTPKMTTWMRRAFTNILASKYPLILVEVIDSKEYNSSVRLINKSIEGFTVEDVQRLRKDAIEAEIFNEVGFRHILEAVIAAKKPIVGHNMMYDLMFTYEHYIDQLPESFDEFRRNVRTMFPIVFDTKHFSAKKDLEAGDDYASTALGDLFKLMKDDTTRPLVKYSFAKTDAGADAAFPKAIKFDLYETLEQAHDAGYDSLMTGLVFASLIGREGLEYSEISHPDTVKRYGNKVNLSTSHKPLKLEKPNQDCLYKKAQAVYLTHPEGVGHFAISDVFQRKVGRVNTKRLHDVVTLVVVADVLEDTSLISQVKLPTGWSMQPIPQCYSTAQAPSSKPLLVASLAILSLALFKLVQGQISA